MVSSIEELYVQPRQGAPAAALMLIRRMIEQLRDAGAQRIQARVLMSNSEGRAFHERCGFTANLLVYEYGQD